MNDKFLDVVIVSPQKIVFKDKAITVTVPGTSGSFQVLYDHAPIFSTTEIGTVCIVNAKNVTEHFAVSQGYVEVSGNSVSVVTDLAVNSNEISEDEVNGNLVKLRNQLAEAEKSEQDDLIDKIKFEEAKLKVISFNK